MKKLFFPKQILTLVAMCLPASIPLTATHAVAQSDEEKVGSRFVPVDGMVAAMASPAELLKSETLKMYPTEIADAWCLEYVGVELNRLQSVRLIVATPGLGDAMFGAVFQFAEPVDATSLNADFVGGEIKVDGRDAFEMIGPPGVAIHQLAPDTIVVASKPYLDSVVKSTGDPPSGPLAKLAANASHDGHLTILFAVEPIRPTINGIVQAIAPQLPPAFVEFTRVPDLLDAITLRINLDDSENGIRLDMLARDEDSAEQLEDILVAGLEMGKQIALSETFANMPGDGAVPESMRDYALRVANRIVDAVTPERRGKTLTVTASLEHGLTSPALMMGFLMPVMRVSSLQPPRQRAINNFRQIGLAMHNHHSAFRELPDTAIRDDDGEPLLSWRVKILPFIEQQDLYQQFHLDEPWDSPHNKKLIAKMPAVYRHPLVETAEGATVFQLPLHEECIGHVDGPTPFRDVRDGLSNTVMIVQSDAESAVPWTKPADWEVDLDDPFAGLDINAQGNFTVLFADGGTRELSTREVGDELMKAILTIDGGERFDLD